MKIIGYVCDAYLPQTTENDMHVLDTINIAFGLVSKDHTLDSSNLLHMDELKRLRSYGTSTRIVLSVGGWGAGGFSLMSRTKEGRKKFADSCAAYVKTYGLDGIDIDWEYPCNDSAEIDCDPADRENYTLLLAELRRVLGADKTVSVAVGAGAYFVRDTQMDKVADICDYVQLMTYDMRSGFCREAGHHTALYASGTSTEADTDYVVNMYVSAGVPLEKLVIGAAFYARVWDGVLDVNHGLYQQAQSVGQYGAGFTGLVENYINMNGFVRYWDDDAKAPYLFNGSTFISYDDAESVRAKCEYVKQKRIPGIMYWEHGCDPSRTLLNVMEEYK